MAFPSERTLERVLSNIDEEAMRSGVKVIMEDVVVPELENVRRRAAENDDDPAVLRERLKALPDEKQDRYFQHWLDQILITLFMLRIDPIVGAAKAKGLLRDPYVLESLLLIYEDRAVDDADADKMKQFTAEHVHMVGVILLPEMYSDEEAATVWREWADVEYSDSTIETLRDHFDQYSIHELAEVSSFDELVDDDVIGET